MYVSEAWTFTSYAIFLVSEKTVVVIYMPYVCDNNVTYMRRSAELHCIGVLCSS